jgi:tryptophan-rich sensory protein
MPAMISIRLFIVFFGFMLLSFAAAGIGSVFTVPGVRTWYPSLTKPTWTPPAWVFGPVWTVLYLCIAVAGFLAWRNAGFTGARWTFTFFVLQLVLNTAWSWIFFGLRNPGWGFAEIVLFWMSILVTTVLMFDVSQWAGLLFVPYLLWVTFAAVLNFSIWRLN